MARCYLRLFWLYINIKICKKKLLNVKLAGNYPYGKLLFTWLSLTMSMMVCFCVVLFFPRDVLDKILNLIESVSGGFPSYSCMLYIDINCLTHAWLSSIEQTIMSDCQKEVKSQTDNHLHTVQYLIQSTVVAETYLERITFKVQALQI